MSDKDEAPAFDLSLSAHPYAVERVSPLVRRIVCGNASPFTFRGTCAYIVGAGSIAIVDPGPDDPRQLAALLAAIDGETLTDIVVTHTHRDHSPGARALKAATGARIVGAAGLAPRPPPAGATRGLDAANDPDHAPDLVLSDGDVLEGRGWRLEAIATPGHASNHLTFALPDENALFSGDHVMAWSTTIVAPPDGSMRAYMESLEKLRARGETRYWPGHGGPVTEPARFLRALAHHRRQREAAILERVRAGDATIAAIVARVYAGLDPRLTAAAALSTFAHVEDLLERGLVSVDGAPTLGAAYRAA